jgi:hypothetical protein
MTHNPNARATQHYSIVEDLTQAPCVMSSLEVLQIFLTQHKYLLTSIGGIYPSDSNTIPFNVDQSEPYLSHRLSLQIIIRSLKKNIFQTMIYEGVATCIMSMNFWKSLGSPQITTSETILKAFDGHFFKPHGIFPSLPFKLVGKTTSVEVEVVDTNLDYNILLGRTWFYAMKAVTSSTF